MSVYVIQNITSLIIVNTHIFYFITLILFLKCLSFTVGGIVSLWVFRFLDIDWTLTLVAWQWWQLFLFQLGEGNQTVRFKPWCTFKLAPVPYSITTVDSPVSSDNPIIPGWRKNLTLPVRRCKFICWKGKVKLWKRNFQKTPRRMTSQLCLVSSVSSFKWIFPRGRKSRCNLKNF